MTRTQRYLATAALLTAAFAGSASVATAGRFGGPASESGVVRAGQSVYFDIPFAALSQANVTVMGNGFGNVELLIYDGDGNVTVGEGLAERRVALVNVYRAGYFRVELRNTGPVDSFVLIGTN